MKVHSNEDGHLVATFDFIDMFYLNEFYKSLCKKNLKSNRVKCCARCPFKRIISEVDPEAKKLFDKKELDVG